jgi:hypothetical protein
LYFPPSQQGVKPKRRSLELHNLETEIFPSDTDVAGRILIVEDPSNEVIEILGSSLDIDPVFFASHVHAPYRHLAAQTPNLAILPSRTRRQSFLNIHYHRTLELDSQVSQKCSGKWLRDTNMGRKLAILPPTREKCIGLVQHACSILLLKQGNHSQSWLCI